MGMYVGGEIADLAAIGRPRDRRRDGGPAGPPVADRDDRGDRAGEGRARRGAAAPTASAILNADDERVRRMAAADARPGSMTYGFAPDADVARRGRRVARAPTGCAFDLVAAGGRRPVDDPDARPARGPQRAGRGGRRARRRAAARRRSSAALAARLVARRTAAQLDPRRRRHDRRRQLQRLARLGASPRWSCSAGLPGRRVAVLGEMLELGDAHDGGPRAGRRGGRRGRRPARRRRRRARPGSPTGRRDGRARRRPRSPRSTIATAAAGRLLARRSGPATSSSSRRRAAIDLDLLVDELVAAGRAASATADDRRADPGPAARLRDRRDPDAAVHPAAAGDRASRKQIRIEGPDSHQVKHGHADDGRRC